MIRTILNSLELLTESASLTSRKPGEIFRNSSGKEITFTQLKFYPEKGGKYTKEQLDSVIDDVTSDIDVQWMNAQSGRTGGFAIATFTGDEGELYFGKFLTSVNTPYANNFIENKIGDYKYAGKSGQKAQSNVSPQDLLIGNTSKLTINGILKQLKSSLGAKSSLYALAVRVANGETFPLYFSPPEDVTFEAFRDYFCEILHPIAIQVGSYVNKSTEDPITFLGGSTKDTLISFDVSKTAGLSDSIIYNSSGKELKISSKGGAIGASSSVGNLLNCIEELKITESGRKLIRKHKKAIDLLTTIQSEGQYNAPLVLAVELGIINEKEADQVRALRGAPFVNLDKIDNINISARLERFAFSKEPSDSESLNLFYHLLSIIAAKVANKINEESSFSKAATDILNHSALVQMNTKAKQSTDVWILQEFALKYPGDSVKGVLLSAHKSYMSTQIKGNFTFLLDKGAGVPKSKESTKISSKERPLRPKKSAPKIGVGRAKRKR